MIINSRQTTIRAKPRGEMTREGTRMFMGSFSDKLDEAPRYSCRGRISMTLYIQQPGQSLEKRGQGVHMFASFITVRLIKFLFHSLFILLRGKYKGHWWWKAHCHKFFKKTSRSYSCQIHWKKDIFLTIISRIITYPWAKDKHWLLLCTKCKKMKNKTWIYKTSIEESNAEYFCSLGLGKGYQRDIKNMTHKRENDKLDFTKIKNSAFWKMLLKEERQSLTSWCISAKHIPVYFIPKIYKELSKVKKKKKKHTPNDPI